MKDKRELFKYHTADHVKQEYFDNIRMTAKILADIIDLTPGNEEDKEKAISKLRECVFYAVASIAIPEPEKL